MTNVEFPIMTAAKTYEIHAKVSWPYPSGTGEGMDDAPAVEVTGVWELYDGDQVDRCLPAEEIAELMQIQGPAIRAEAVDVAVDQLVAHEEQRIEAAWDR